MTATPDAVRMRGITKLFGQTRALNGVDFDVAPGEVHALLGENGAGKSTLMHVLFGLLRADAGSIEVFGRPLAGHAPRAALAAGIGLVQQHFSLVPRMSVAEHVALGQRGVRFDRRTARDLVLETGRSTGLTLDPDAHAGDLSAGLRQRLEIVKTLARKVRVLILDEPTASLAPAEVLDLFAALRRLAGQGMSVVLITHKLAEVPAIANRVTVLRRGEVTARGLVGTFTPESLAVAVIGDAQVPAAQTSPPPAETTSRGPATVLAARDIVVRSRGVVRVNRATFSILAGEIVGVAAVEGNGQRELLRAVAGLLPFEGALALGPGASVGFIPEDRQTEGLILDFSLRDNLALDAALAFWLNSGFLQHQAAVAVDEFDIRVSNAEQPVRTLSGGNQQKIVLARVLAQSHALLVAENPTRGLDVRSTADVHARIREAAHQKHMGVLLHSSDLDEVLGLADRIAVMAGGVWHWVDDAQRSRERIGAMMLGGPAA